MSQGRSDRADVIVGIDLGTTNSLVAWCDEQGPRVLLDDAGRALVPSVVRVELGGDDAGAPRVARTIVGTQALEAANDQGITIASVKRLIGRSAHDVAGDVPFLAYQVVGGERDTARIVLAQPASDGAPPLSISPEEVSALVLAELKRIGEARLGQPVTKAVVTVPAYFDDAQRQATRVAGRLAGLDVVRVVPEPTAAALAYGLGLARGSSRRQRGVSHVAVYDLGGGTFDISVLRLTPAEGRGEEGTDFYQVLATSGDTRLGGDDMDHALVREFVARVAGEVPGALSAGMETIHAQERRALAAEARRVKHVLTSEDRVTFGGRLGGRAHEWNVTREEFERIIGALVDRTIARCEQAVADARGKGLPAGELGEALDAVILVGGSTRVPLVREKVRAFFGREGYTAIDPDQAIALGASVQAAILSGGRKGSLLLDVIPLSLGIETVGGAVAKLIVRNSTVPAKATEMFSTSVDGQTSIRLSVYQGEREMATDCRKLGDLIVRGIPAMPAGLPQLEVMFFVDANGVLSVHATERRSGKRATMQVVPNYGLTNEEVERIERESLTHARTDMRRHRVADLISHASLDISAITRTLGRVEVMLEPEYVSRLRACLDEVRGFVDRAKADWASVDANAFQRAKETLDRESMRLHEVAITQSLRGQRAPTPGSERPA